MAKNLYFTQTGAGTHDGLSLANAWSVSEASTAGNWGVGAGKISAGDTLHVSGLVTGALTIQGSGTAGNVITILFDNGGSLSPAAATACFCQSRSYVLFDGGTNGVIENTANGSSLANQVATSGIYANGSDNLEVKNLTFRNLYVHITSDNAAYAFDSNGAVYFNTFGNNISIHDCAFSDICWVLNFQAGSSASGVSIYNNTFTNYDHGVGGLGNSVSNVSIYNNHFGTTAIWDTPANNWHHDAIHIFFNVGGTLTTLAIYNNIFDGDWGVNNTAHIFIEGDYTNANLNAVSSVQIYNNLHIQYPANYLNNGFIAAHVGTCLTANNTFLGAGVTLNPGIFLTGTGQTIKNNIISGVNTFITLATGTTITALDNNLYAAVAAGGNSPFSYLGVGKTFAQWKVSTSGDAASTQVSDAGIASTGVVLVGSGAIGTGLDLSGTFTTDIIGATRSAPWDIGAFKYTTAGVPAQPGNPRKGFRARTRGR